MNAIANRSAAACRRQSGFTIVELMVGVLVALIATIVMFQVFAVSEGQRRTTTGAGDAQQNGVFSLFQMERDARMAGYGINYAPVLGCAAHGFHVPTGTNIDFTLAPVVITNGVGSAPDSITFAYGNADLFVAPVKLLRTQVTPTELYKVDVRFGFNAGDLVLAAEVGRPCTLAQASFLSETPGEKDEIKHDSGTYLDVNGIAQPLNYNKPGGLAAPNNIAYTVWKQTTSTGGRLYNLGPRPTVVTYGLDVARSQLTSTDVLVPGQSFAISDGVVQLQAQYGFDGNGDGRIASNAPSVPLINTAPAGAGGADQWGDALPAGVTAADWGRIVAVRIAVVTRSLQPEKPDPGTGVCNATTAAPQWLTPVPPINLDVSANPDWRCYRYRLFEVMVPIRNMIWFAQPS
jgi:type IV pilus assembly protein PilW